MKILTLTKVKVVFRHVYVGSFRAPIPDGLEVKPIYFLNPFNITKIYEVSLSPYVDKPAIKMTVIETVDGQKTFVQEDIETVKTLWQEATDAV